MCQRAGKPLPLPLAAVADHPFYGPVQLHADHLQTGRVPVDEVVAEIDGAKVGQHDDIAEDTSIEIVAFDLVYQRAQDMPMFGKLFFKPLSPVIPCLHAIGNFCFGFLRNPVELLLHVLAEGTLLIGLSQASIVWELVKELLIESYVDGTGHRSSRRRCRSRQG